MKFQQSTRSCMKERRIMKFKSTNRYIKKTFRSNARQQPVYDGRIELDSHADTFVAGRNCIVMHYTERVCDVMPYSDEYEAKKSIPVVCAATGYTSSNGIRYILKFNEALWMPDMEHSLMNPNQLRDYGVDVQDNPYHLDPMVIRKDDDEGGFIACLKTKGTNVYIDTWTPTDKDLSECRHITLTSPHEWEPEQVQMPSATSMEIADIEERNISGSRRVQGQHIDEEYDVCSLNTFNRRIAQSKVVDTIISDGPLSEDQLRPPKTFISTNRHSNTTPEDLSEIWNISVEQARMTLRSTTQHHVRSAIMPLSRRYRMDRMYEIKRLRCDMASDTMDPRCKAIHGDKYCQVFGNKSMFAAACPISSKADCDIALKKFLRDYGAPDSMTTDGSREQTAKGSKFQAILRKNNVRSIITQPHRPNQNPAETVIRELRKRWY